jgi:hypothetical protein
MKYSRPRVERMSVVAKMAPKGSLREQDAAAG